MLASLGFRFVSGGRIFGFKRNGSNCAAGASEWLEHEPDRQIRPLRLCVPPGRGRRVGLRRLGAGGPGAAAGVDRAPDEAVEAARREAEVAAGRPVRGAAPAVAAAAAGQAGGGGATGGAAGGRRDRRGDGRAGRSGRRGRHRGTSGKRRGDGWAGGAPADAGGAGRRQRRGDGRARAGTGGAAGQAGGGGGGAAGQAGEAAEAAVPRGGPRRHRRRAVRESGSDLLRGRRLQQRRHTCIDLGGAERLPSARSAAWGGRGGTAARAAPPAVRRPRVFPCGSSASCEVNAQYCLQFSPGVPAIPPTYACLAVPAGCLPTPTCSCLAGPGNRGCRDLRGISAGRPPGIDRDAVAP
jgi:hypothetical protein